MERYGIMRGIMLKAKDIKAVETGPRQLTFDFEEKTRAETDNLVISCIREEIRTHGQVFLDHLISHVKETHNVEEQVSLQSVFWSAEALKIHFRISGKPVTPYKARQLLLDCPDRPVELFENKQVEASIFRDLVLFYQQLMNIKKINFQDDQYEFGLSLLLKLKTWKADLASFRIIAEKPFYPGKQKINDHLQFLKTLLAKQDSYSLICKCYEKRESITELAGDIHVLSRFYTQQTGFWDLLIKSMAEYEDTLSELSQHPEAASGLDRLNRILSSPTPWDLIFEAEQLLRTVQNHHDRIVAEKIQTHRMAATSFIDALIKKLNRMPVSGTSEEDQRSRCLYLLRIAEKQLQTKTTIEEIDELVDNAEDMAEEVLNFY